MEQVAVDDPSLKDRGCKSRCMSTLSDLIDLGLVLLDVVLDVYTVVSLYQEEAYVFMGLLVFILLGSSLLVNSFSLLWYLDGRRESKTESLVKNLDGRDTRKENHLKNLCSLKILHVFQLGVFLRISICGFCCEKLYTTDEVRSLKNDLCILRLIETFSESAPQLVLMLTIFIMREDLGPITSAFIYTSVTTYHRSMCSFAPDKAKQGWGFSVLYFLWNLLLIGSRVMAVALFASAFPRYIAAHFLCSWMVLFFFAWRCKTKFMNSDGKEWFDQATVGLIWYFNWFNMVPGKSRWRSIVYHTWMVLDIGILCGFWVWQIKKSSPYFDIPLDPYFVLGVIMSLYFAGLGLKVIFMYCHQQTKTDERLEGTTNENEVNSAFRCVGHEESFGPPEQVIRVNKRMKILADNFYS
uniref:XK-related protein n=1 Tax=Esox lucius TaxID=8010 RepID=A0AAY5KXL7_ESOLU